LNNEGLIDTLSFSMYLNKTDDVTEEGELQNGGEIIFGGID